MLELRHLRYFIAVAEELHFTRAAERLNIAQPPLSQQIRQLEELVGVTLFTRTKRRVALTQAGRVFLEEARRTVAQASFAVRAAQQAGRGEIGRLEIGFVASAPFNVLPRILKAYRKKFPQVRVVLHEMSTAMQVPALLEGRIDVGFVRLPLEHEEVQLEVILKEPMVAAIPDRHRLARRKRLSVRELAGEPFVIFPHDAAPGHYGHIMGMCWQAGFTPEVSQEASEMQTIVGLVGAGLGVALVPSSVQNIRGMGVVYVPLAERSAVSMAMAWRKTADSRLMAEFREVARLVTSAPP